MIKGKLKLSDKAFVYRAPHKPESHLEYMALDYELIYVISEMERKLAEAKLKDISRDFSDAELKIRILNDFRKLFLETIQDNITLENFILKVTNQFHGMNDLITKQAAEIEKLKKELKF